MGATDKGIAGLIDVAPGAGVDHMAPRVLRGGSFNNNRDNVRCAYRNNNEPDNINRNIGLRVAASHGFRHRPCRKCRAV